VNPHLPAGWDRASVSHLPLPDGDESLYISREGDHLNVTLSDWHHAKWHLQSDSTGARTAVDINGSATMRVPLPALEVDQLLAKESEQARNLAPLPNQPPIPGARSERFRIVREDSTEHKLVLVIEGPANSVGAVSLLRHGQFVPLIQVDPSMPSGSRQNYAGISTKDDSKHDPSNPILLSFHFPPGEGWKTITVTLTW